MLQSLFLSSSSSSMILGDVHYSSRKYRISCSSSCSMIHGDVHDGSRKYMISCSSSSRNKGYIPKLKPFSRSRLERAIKDPPLIERTENQLAEYCCTLEEGDECYNCWKAYFELKDLEKEAQKKDVERLIIESGGIKSLVGDVHRIAEIYRIKKQGNSKTGKGKEEEEVVKICPIPDGLPKSREELEEEEIWKMPDSQFTKLLRVMGKKNPAWYSSPPDH